MRFVETQLSGQWLVLSVNSLFIIEKLMREHATAVFGPGSAHAQLVKIKKFSSERKRASKKYCVDGPESAPPPTPELVNIKMRASASERAKKITTFYVVISGAY